MPAIKTSAARILAGLAVSAFFVPAVTLAATLVVNNEEPLSISTSPGFTYIVTGPDGNLSVPTEGFLFCANVYSGDQPAPTAVTVVPQHGDWRLPAAQDVATVAYSAGTLRVNRSNQTSLMCHGVGAQGEILSPLTEGLLRNGYESRAAEQFPRMINWAPIAGFDWSAPDWSLVPTDPCNPSPDQPAQVDEDVTCAAVSGARNGVGGATRSPIMWTGTDGLSFFYIVRVDARYGPQNEANSGPQFPIDAGYQPDGVTGAMLRVVEGYDRGVVGVGGGYLGDNGQWCRLLTLPSTLDGNVCVGAPTFDLTGPLNQSIALDVTTTLYTSFYMAFVRPIVGPPPALNEPAVAVSILLEPAVSAEGGDKFKGDDVVFGFLPSSTGFSWMSGQ